MATSTWSTRRKSGDGFKKSAVYSLQYEGGVATGALLVGQCTNFLSDAFLKLQPVALEVAMAQILKKAVVADVPQLLSMMRDNYLEDGISFDGNEAKVAFEGLIEDSRNGHVWLIIDDETVVGYTSLTLGYSLEFGGRDAFIDDLYVRPQSRNHGFGGRALEAMIKTAEAAGVRAVHLEVDRENERARHLYEKTGFKPRQRYFLMSKYLRCGRRKAESRADAGRGKLTSNE